MSITKLRKMMTLVWDLQVLEELGGRGSFFGMQHVFEEILEEEHIKIDGEEEGMYRYKGMEQYGNIVSPNAVSATFKRCRKDYSFTREEFESLSKWYSERDYGPDTKILGLCLKWSLEDELKEETHE